MRASAIEAAFAKGFPPGGRRRPPPSAPCRGPRACFACQHLMQATAAFVPVFLGGDMAVSCSTDGHGRMALAWRGLLGSRTPVLDGTCDATDADQEYPSSQGQHTLVLLLVMLSLRMPGRPVCGCDLGLQILLLATVLRRPGTGARSTSVVPRPWQQNWEPRAAGLSDCPRAAGREQARGGDLRPLTAAADGRLRFVPGSAR
jgi:hypothetical protein